MTSSHREGQTTQRTSDTPSVTYIAADWYKSLHSRSNGMHFSKAFIASFVVAITAQSIVSPAQEAELAAGFTELLPLDDEALARSAYDEFMSEKYKRDGDDNHPHFKRAYNFYEDDEELEKREIDDEEFEKREVDDEEEFEKRDFDEYDEDELEKREVEVDEGVDVDLIPSDDFVRAKNNTSHAKHNAAAGLDFAGARHLAVAMSLAAFAALVL